MTAWTFYPIFIGTAISVIGLSRIANKTYYINSGARPISEGVATEEKLLLRFRNILIICDALFALTVFGFLAPRAGAPSLIYFFGILMIGGELMLSLTPARDNTVKLHLSFAYIMAVGMLGLAATFWLKQVGAFSSVEAGFTALLLGFGLLIVVDKKRWLIYEMGYIFASHFSLLAAAIALK